METLHGKQRVCDTSAIGKLHGSVGKDKTGDYFGTTVLTERMGIKAEDIHSKTCWEMFENILSEKELKEKKLAKGKTLNEKMSVEELEELIDDEKLERIEEGIWVRLLQKHNLLLDVLLYRMFPLQLSVQYALTL